MNGQALRFRIGVFVLSAVILLAVLIMLFGSFPTLLKQHSEYTVTFDMAPGVGPGTPVRRSGVRIGEVRSLELDDGTGKVRIQLLIERPHSLYQNDQAILAHGLLSGDTSIDLVPRRPNGQAVELTPVPPGAEFTGTNQADVATLLNQTSALVPSAQESLNQIQQTLQRLEKMTPLMEETMREYRDLARGSREAIPDLRRTNDEILVAARNWGRLGERLDVLLQTNQDKLEKTLDNLNDTVVRVGTVFNDENQRNLAALLKNVRAGSENLESISKNTDALLSESRMTMRRVNDSVTQADQVLVNLQQATRPMAERSANVMRNLDESADRLNKLLTDLRELSRGIGQGDGTLRRLLNDPSLYNNLNDAACMLARIMPRVDQILRDFQVFADKVARHPESLGVGGAISPSSGLKESPSAGVFGTRH